MIAHSVQSRDHSLREYAIARAARIVPVAWFALGFAALSMVTVTALGRSPGLDLGQFGEHDARTLPLPLLFLSERATRIAGPA